MEVGGGGGGGECSMEGKRGSNIVNRGGRIQPFGISRGQQRRKWRKEGVQSHSAMGSEKQAQVLVSMA